MAGVHVVGVIGREPRKRYKRKERSFREFLWVRYGEVMKAEVEWLRTCWGKGGGIGRGIEWGRDRGLWRTNDGWRMKWGWGLRKI